eukprot:m.9465 g.9465  ORF g.9465 m.9465 type:complete len:86 (-) comp5747_c0_seq1:274-531(-)
MRHLAILLRFMPSFLRHPPIQSNKPRHVVVCVDHVAKDCCLRLASLLLSIGCSATVANAGAAGEKKEIWWGKEGQKNAPLLSYGV